MRTLSLVSSAALLALSCSSAPPHRVSATAAVGTLSTPVRVRAADLPPASTFAFAEVVGAPTPQVDSIGTGRLARDEWRAELTFADVASPRSRQLEMVVAGLLERRGWRAAEPGEADVVVGVALAERLDPSSDSDAAAGDVLHRERYASGSAGVPAPAWVRETKVLSVKMVSASGRNWSAQTWAESRLVEEPSWLRLVVSLADSLPRASVLSPEAAAMVRLGVDFLALPGSGAAGSSLVVVAGVEAGSPAEHAGWRPRDELVAIGGQPTDQARWREIAARLAAAEGEAVPVELLRAGERYLTYLVPAGLRPVT